MDHQNLYQPDLHGTKKINKKNRIRLNHAQDVNHRPMAKVNKKPILKLGVQHVTTAVLHH